nr:ATP-dependent DNA helicase PIF1-like [Tanacetum cinerariifolium]
STIQNPPENTPWSIGVGYSSPNLCTPDAARALRPTDSTSSSKSSNPNPISRFKNKTHVRFDIGSPDILPSNPETYHNVLSTSKSSTIDKGKSIADIPVFEMTDEESEDEYGYTDQYYDHGDQNKQCIKCGALYLACRNRRGPFCFRIQGENNHVIGDLIPKPRETPKFRQLYIYDPPNEIQNCVNVVSTSIDNASSSLTKQIDRQLTTDLKSMLDLDNPLVKQYRLAGHRLSNGESNVKLRLIGRRHHDGRQHNLPTANEVVALIIGDFDSMPNERDIIVYEKNGKLKKISELHVSYLPLQYPLLFPYAEDGYRTEVYIIEFQKQGLPHCHLCVWLETEDKLRLPADIDSPCGPEHRNCPCMVENKCLKNFPMKFNENASLMKVDMPCIKGAIMVEPLENKGPDRVTAAVEDEETYKIKDYYDCRYLSSCEAAWRIFKFDIHHRSPAVERLPFYLPNQQGAQKWEDLKEFDDVVYPTCKDACFARGLLEDDKEYIDEIIKASDWGMGDYLRNYFVMLIISDSISRPEFDSSTSSTLCNLTNEQKVIYETIVDAAENNKGGMFFVFGYEGTGKRFLYKTLTAALRSKRQIVLNVASSGIASLFLDGGRTTHSRFSIPINVVKDYMCIITADSDLADLIRETKLIIWDEALMINRLAFEAFDRTLRDIATGTHTPNSDNVFGGKVVVFGGDFRKILPVIPNGSRQDVVHASLSSSYLWNHCTVLKLTQNLRLHVGSNPADVEEINGFAQWNLNIGEGKIGGKNDGHAEVEFPEEMLIPDLDDHVGSVIKEVYDDWEQNMFDPTYFQDRAILAPAHEHVDKVNNRMMAMLPGRENVCYSSDTITDVDIDFNYSEALYTTEFLNSIRMSGIPHHKLVLKVGAPVMCMRNIDQRGGLCDGTRSQILRMAINNIEAKIISGDEEGDLEDSSPGLDSVQKKEDEEGDLEDSSPGLDSVQKKEGRLMYEYYYIRQACGQVKNLALMVYITAGSDANLILDVFAENHHQRALVSDEFLVLDLHGTMTVVVQQTHYMPKRWRGKENTEFVRVEFETLFQYTEKMLLEEMDSIFLTPFLLIFVVPEEYIIDVEGVGHVCSFSLFDFRKHAFKVAIHHGSQAQTESNSCQHSKTFKEQKFQEQGIRPSYMSLNRMPQWASTLRGQGDPNSYFSRDITPNISHSTYQLECLWLIDPVHKNHPYILDWYYTSCHHRYTTVNPQDIESGPVDDLEESMPNVEINIGASTSAPLLRRSVLQQHDSGNVTPG